MIRHVADRLRPITLPLHRLLSRLAPRRVEALLLATGLALLGLWAAHQNGIRAYEVGASRRLDLLTYAAQVGRPGNEPDPATGVAAVVAGSNLIGRIEIPRLDISAIIAEGTNPGTLKRAVGHIRSTAYPGEAGNVGLAGHRDTHFRGLGRVQLNDLIRLVTPEGTFDYRVEWTKVVSPRRVEVLKPAGAPSVTLVTCYPFNYVGSAPKRFIVRARLVSESVAALSSVLSQE